MDKEKCQKKWENFMRKGNIHIDRERILQALPCIGLESKTEELLYASKN